MTVEPGVYIAFFEDGEPAASELPPVGPLDHVVVRQTQLVVERKSVQQSYGADTSIDRWFEAELELQRASGVEAGGTRRRSLRVTGPEGVFLRFAMFGDPRETAALPEFGPFAVVIVRRNTIEADGILLATRTTGEPVAWSLGPGAGAAYAGMRKTDVGLRTVGATYHPAIGQGPPQPAPKPAAPAVTAPPAVKAPPMELPPLSPPAAPRTVSSEPIILPPAPLPRPPEPVTLPPPPSQALTERDLNLIARIEAQRAEEPIGARAPDRAPERPLERVAERAPVAEQRLTTASSPEAAAASWSMRHRPATITRAALDDEDTEGGAATAVRALLWALRIPLLAVLVLGIGIYLVVVARSLTAPAGPHISTVGLAQRMTGARWDYVVSGVQRAQTAGQTRPRGIFLVVRVDVTNRGSDDAQLSPSQFDVADDSGLRYPAASVASAVYRSAQNVTPFAWPTRFPSGSAVIVPLIFDVDPAAKGLRLLLSEVPTVQVKLD